MINGIINERNYTLLSKNFVAEINELIIYGVIRMGLTRTSLWSPPLSAALVYRDHFVYAPSQWQTILHCNVVCHWLGAYTKRSLGVDFFAFSEVWNTKVFPCLHDVLCKLHQCVLFSDTIYFHLPSLQEKDRTVYGVSCYRQIDAKVSWSSVIMWKLCGHFS